tara:strand:- start:520 stop:657 length:138 start_codon:yes stop_codon:yes gene_type:complete
MGNGVIPPEKKFYNIYYDKFKSLTEYIRRLIYALKNNRLNIPVKA